MISIELHDIRIFAHHGVYVGEDQMGNNFSVDLVVNFDEGSTHFETLTDTINYEELFEIVKQRMKVDTPLLERIAEGIIRKIKHRYPFVTEARISIYKLQAAIENLQGRVGITMHKKFED